MSVVNPGDSVIEIVKSANKRIILVAPYIKSTPLRYLLNHIPDKVSECICVTRWLPEDIASGVCDLEILDDLNQVSGGQLLVHPHLHAKFYSNGQKALIGSANLTARGLSWSTPSNVELTVALPAESDGLAEWEQSLLKSAVQATEQLRENIRIQAEAMKLPEARLHIPEVEEDTVEKREPIIWVPTCPVPDRLWQVYGGHDADKMVTSAFEAAKSDLAALKPPLGLTKDLFYAYVAGIFRQMPVLHFVDELAESGVTDDEAQDLLDEKIGKTSEEFDAQESWRVIKAWLFYFFPETYLSESRQDVLVKGRELHRQ